MNNKRFIFFADFLGTKNRYSSPPLVLRSRQLLEQTLDIYFIPHLDRLDINLYLFSDTLIVTCPRLDHLLEPISNLFNHFLDFQENKETNKMNLWLRAAISYGEIVESSHLYNQLRVRSIPLLDTSLPHAYALESVRPGSRIFIDPSINADSFGEYHKYFLKWQQITGRGKFAANVGEFLWPAKIKCDIDRLVKKTIELNIRWKDLLDDKEWSKNEYYERLIHLDETLKLFIRTCTAFCPDNVKKDVLFSILPTSEADVIDVQYEWGVWFQALKGILSIPNIKESEAQKLESYIPLIKNILTSNVDKNYYTHFLGELEFPDYSYFKEMFYKIGISK